MSHDDPRYRLHLPSCSELGCEDIYLEPQGGRAMNQLPQQVGENQAELEARVGTVPQYLPTSLTKADCFTQISSICTSDQLVSQAYVYVI
jgi:hypothetical protein